MDRFLKMISLHLPCTVSILAGAMLPGMLTIAIFNRTLFFELDVIKLVLLSTAISTTGAMGLFIITFLMFAEREDSNNNEAALIFSFGGNIVIFSIAILSKVFFRSMELKYFVEILLGAGIIWCIFLGIIKPWEPSK